MSRAGTKSNQGDDYQRMVAMHWLIRLLSDDNIHYIQAESNGLPGIDEKVSIDDIVIVYKDGKTRNIQAKKNQPTNRAWNLSDLKGELLKIKDQLEVNSNVLVELYSRTPFGDLQSLCEASREYTDLAAFQREAGQVLQKTLGNLAREWCISENETLQLLRRLEFGPYHSFDEWLRLNRQELSRLVPHVELALPVLESFLNTHQSKLQSTSLTIHREHVLEQLKQAGLTLAPTWDEAEILGQFRQASRIGREWKRTVGDQQIRRLELDELITLVDSGADTVLVTDRPGSGKTCLLLDLADHIESGVKFGMLFIKGDRFNHLCSDANLKAAGLPEDIVGFCGRLSEYRRVVVIIDSLDVLSLNREHGAMTFFLNLIDRLNSMRGVTVIAACRSFDLKYDPMLRDRKWEHEIHLADFDYDTVVAPLLKEWGITETNIDEELKQLLRLPQNLRLFEAVAQRSESQTVRNAYELHEIYLDEVVLKNSNLGHPAMVILQQLADRLVHERSHLIPLAAFTGDETILRALVSNGVLYQDSVGNLGFGHQTLFDSLVVYSALARGDDLATFIKAHPPFPFLRPAVRTFVFHLRTHAPEVFPRQLWAVLTDEDVAYHFKRLIVESLAEIVPQEKDWPLIRRLFQMQPELFRRLFWCVEGKAWFRFLVDHWLPSLGLPATDGEWYTLFVTHFDRWMDSHPKEVVTLWLHALSDGWDKTDRLQWRISIDLCKFSHWETKGIRELIEVLQKDSKSDRDMLGKVISRYVVATNQGDDLLWRYITKDVDKQDTQGLSFGYKLHCEPHNFHKEQFLKDRLILSDQLLNLVINSLKKWAARDTCLSTQHTLRSSFLHKSSWQRRHSQHDTHYADSMSVLMDGVEQAFIHHAVADDAWWRENEEGLRSTPEETIRYFLAKAYTANPESNVDGMSVMLSDKDLLCYGQINHELGEMISIGYHLLDKKVQERNQSHILGLYDDEDWGEDEIPEWTFRNIYEFLIWIPGIFRLPESQSFIDQYQPIFGDYRPTPQIYSSGGWVGSPVSLNQLLALSNEGIFRLMDYYDDYRSNSSHPADNLTGGRDMVERTLNEAAACDPVRYLDLVPELVRREFHSSYLASLLEGVSNHLRYRFGRLQHPKGWQPTEPEPDGTSLAHSMLNQLEALPEILDDGYATVRILEACCEVLHDKDSVERLVFLLFRLLRHPSPEIDKQIVFNQDKEGIASDDLLHIAINSVRGIAAGSAISLCNRLLTLEKEPPELLFPLLRHYARDPVQAVHAALLNHLPSLTYKRRSWGWQLFRDIFHEPQRLLWPLAERHLYYQYHEHFDDVAPFLERMLSESPKESAKVWARITTLASISGHIDQDDLFQRLEFIGSMSAWEGAAQVFAANLDTQKNNGLCSLGLGRILELEEHSESLFSTIAHAFSLKKHGRRLDQEFAKKFIDAIESGARCHNLYELLDWTADVAGRDPIIALGVCEQLVDKLSDLESSHELWRTESLISTLSSILREADETEDELLIRRAVKLQDKFLRMDIHGIDDYFMQAGRS